MVTNSIPWFLQRLEFKYTRVRFVPRITIERFFSLVDWRSRRFWENFPEKLSIERVERWVESFAGFINFYMEVP